MLVGPVPLALRADRLKAKGTPSVRPVTTQAVAEVVVHPTPLGFWVTT